MAWPRALVVWDAVVLLGVAVRVMMMVIIVMVMVALVVVVVVLVVMVIVVVVVVRRLLDALGDGPSPLMLYRRRGGAQLLPSYRLIVNLSCRLPFGDALG